MTPTTPTPSPGPDDAPRPAAVPTLTSRASTGVAWSASSRVLIQVVQLGTTSVLARLILPSQFGLVALVMVFVGFAYIFSDLGVGAAVVHRKDPDQTFLSTAFWLNTVAGFLLTGFMMCLSPLIAWFFHQPALTVLVIVASCNYSVAMFAVHSALLQKSLRFKAIGIIETCAVLVYAGSAIGMGAAGFGAMALVVGSLLQAAVTTVLFWLAVRWRPTTFIRRSAAREVWQFSGGLVGYNAVNYWTRNIDNLAVGRFSSPTDLAFYSRAYNLMLLPVTQMNLVVGRVLFPVLSLVRDDPARLRNAYLRILRVIVAIGSPVAVLLATAAPAAVRVLYGPRWTDTAPILTVFAIAAIPQLVGITCGPLYQALGLTGSQFRRGLVTTASTVAAVAAGLPWGALGVAIAVTVRFWLFMPVTTSGVWPSVGLTLRTAVIHNRGALAASVVMATASLGARWGLSDLPAIALLFVQAVAGMVAYLVVLLAVDRTTISDVVGLARRR